MEQPRLVSAKETAEIASIGEYIRYVRRGYEEHSRDAPLMPRARLSTERSAELMSYLAVLPELGVMGGYVYSSENDQWYLTPLFDSASGQLLGVVDGSTLSPYKTAAASGVAIDELARENATDLLVFGSGPQAQSQAKAAAAVREVQNVWIHSLDSPEAAKLATTLERDLDVSASSVDDRDEYVHSADIIVTATTDTTPVFDGSLVEPGTHVTAMGQSDTDEREIDSDVVKRAIYVADSETRCMDESGEYNIPLEEGLIDTEHFHGELGDVVGGKVTGRTADDQITVFDSGGTAIETVASAYLVLERAQDAEIGQPFPITPMSEASLRI